MAKQPNAGAETHYSEAERAVIFQRVCDIYQSQQCTVESACKVVGLSGRTFFLWKAKFAELSAVYIKAREKQEEMFWEDVIRPLTKSALKRHLECETKKEVTEVEGLDDNGEMILKKKITNAVPVLPNPSVTIFTAKGMFPDKFKEEEETRDITVTFVTEAPKQNEAQ